MHWLWLPRHIHVHPFGRAHMHVLLAHDNNCTLRSISLAPPSATTLVLMVEARAQLGYPLKRKTFIVVVVICKLLRMHSAPSGFRVAAVLKLEFICFTMRTPPALAIVVVVVMVFGKSV